MNQNYAKENVILEAIRTILVGDNAILTTQVKSIHQYCEDRIIKKTAFTEPPGNTLIMMEIIRRGGQDGIPSSNWFLTITAVIPMDSLNAQDIVVEMASRIEFLLNRKPANLNSVVSSTKYLRCRYINHIGTIPVDDDVKKLYKRDVTFDIIVDDEIMKLN